MKISEVKKSDIKNSLYVEVETKMDVLAKYGSWDFMADFDDRGRTDIEAYQEWEAACWVTIEIRDGEETFYAVQEPDADGRYKKWELQETGDDEQTIADVLQMIADENCMIKDFQNA